MEWIGLNAKFRSQGKIYSNQKFTGRQHPCGNTTSLELSVDWIQNGLLTAYSACFLIRWEG